MKSLVDQSYRFGKLNRKTMAEETIKNLEDLIQKSTKSTKKLVKTTVKRLTAPGENYAGIVLKVDAVVKNEIDEEENFSAVAKCLNFNIPEFFKKITPLLYEKENSFYTQIVPTLEEFQKEIGLEEKGITGIFPKLYTSRRSLDENSEEPDEDSVLLIEYLGDKGYVNTDRAVGFDLDGAKLILKDLAAFHAITLALKIKKPDVFQNKIRKHLYKIIDECNYDPPPPPPDEVKREDLWLRILEPYDEVEPYRIQLREILSKSEEEFVGRAKRKPREPWATLCHSDLWTNNTMQIFVNGTAMENKFVDFQLYTYGSAAEDVIFFLWTSVQLPVLQDHFDDLLKFYHENFINLLDKCGCDIGPFCYEHFLKEIDESAKLEFLHIMSLTPVIYAKKGEAVVDIEEDAPVKEDKITEAARKRTAYLVSTFGKNGWLHQNCC